MTVRLFGILFSLLTLAISSTFGQGQDSIQTRVLENVTITAYQQDPFRENALLINPIYIDSLSNSGNFNLTDLMTATPGVRMLSTGPGISKPVVRGLYGNRLLILLSGLKFDNQQWQEEHGLGLSEMGLSKVEVIKGPMSVLYGSEAVGGIINLVEETKPAAGIHVTDASLKLHSNTLGGLVYAGYKQNNGNNWFRIRLGVENHADYSDGNDNRILNSRMDGYYLKASYGFQKKNWISENHYSGSYNRFGFIFNDLYDFIEPDTRWSRNLSDNPAHLVLLNIFNSENRIYLNDGSKLNINFGVQSNSRKEKEGAGAISLNMHLITVQYLTKWEKTIGTNQKVFISQLTSFENNINYGARKIVPDANMQEANLSIYHEYHPSDKFELENGIGAGEKWVKTYFTPLLNGPGKETQSFSKLEFYYNYFTGFSYMPGKQLTFKLNASTGVRIPNLAELASDGLHEGVFTYEIGDPNLKNEQSFSLNLLADYQSKYVEAEISPFYNIFSNYVYLAPTNEEWFGFPIYRFLQQDATQFGLEATLAIKPTKGLRIATSYEGMQSKTADGNFTPYTPAQKIKPTLNYHFIPAKGKSITLSTEGEYYLAQEQLFPGEIGSNAYFLWNATVSGSITTDRHTYELALSGHNLLNHAYFDHLSRFKYFGLLNMGRNITLSMRVKFHGNNTTVQK